MGLAELKAKRAAEEKRIADRDLPKVDWLSLKLNEDLEVVFLEELEDTAETHHVSEWTANGNGTFRTLVDTTETEGSCYAADLQRKLRALTEDMNEDQRKKFYEKYKVKLGQKIYFSVVKVSDPSKVYAFAQPLTGPLLKTLFKDIDRYGGITGVVYEISKGAQKSDSLTIRRGDDFEGTLTAKPYPIESMARFIPLADQKKYLEKVEPPIEEEKPALVEAVGNPSDNW